MKKTHSVLLWLAVGAVLVFGVISAFVREKSPQNKPNADPDRALLASTVEQGRSSAVAPLVASNSLAVSDSSATYKTSVNGIRRTIAANSSETVSFETPVNGLTIRNLQTNINDEIEVVYSAITTGSHVFVQKSPHILLGGDVLPLNFDNDDSDNSSTKIAGLTLTNPNTNAVTVLCNTI